MEAGNYLKIGNWSVFVLFGWRFVFGIVRDGNGESPSHSDAITTLGLIKLLLSYFLASRQ